MPDATRPADTDGSGFLAGTDFATWYKWLISINPFFSAFFFNFGGIGGCRRVSWQADIWDDPMVTLRFLVAGTLVFLVAFERQAE